MTFIKGRGNILVIVSRGGSHVCSRLSPVWGQMTVLYAPVMSYGELQGIISNLYAFGLITASKN